MTITEYFQAGKTDKVRLILSDDKGKEVAEGEERIRNGLRYRKVGCKWIFIGIIK
jgi:hypothetical protein